MNAPVRTLASPYARRLARERGITLEALAGSGPNGRIVAEDVPLAPVAVAVATPAPAAEAATPAPAAPPVAIAAARSISAFAATVELEPLSAFIAASGAGLSIDAFLVKAAARSAAARADAVRWINAEGGGVTIPRAVALAPTEIARLLAGEADAGAGGKALVLSRLATRGVRPVAGSLPVDADLRFLVVAGDDAATAEVLLVHDAEVVAENDAVAILAAFRDLLETPLRLLV